MSRFLWNLLLAVVWAAITANFSADNLALGFVLGFLVLYFARPVIGSTGYVRRLAQAIALGGFVIWELLLSNLRVAYDVIRPRPRLQPGVIAVPLDVRTDAEITLLANLITLTPGSLSLDVSADRRTLYIHAMDIDDPDALRRKIKDGFERRILAVTR